MAGTSLFQVGDKVSMTNFGEGVVKWVGSNPKFKEGDWLGVELPGATGRNDGSVQGVRYFTCLPGHGVMVKQKGGATLVERDGIRVDRPGTQVSTRPTSTVPSDPSTSAPSSRPVSQAGARPTFTRDRTSTLARSSPPRAAGVARLTRANTSAVSLMVAAPSPAQPIATGSTTPTISNSTEQSRDTDQTQRIASSPADSSPAPSMSDTPTPAPRVFVPRHGRKPSAPLVPSRRAGLGAVSAEEESADIPQLNLQRALSASSAASSHRSGHSARLADLITAGTGQGPLGPLRRAAGSREGKYDINEIGEAVGGRLSTVSASSGRSGEAGPSDVFGKKRTGAGLSRKRKFHPASQQSLTASETSAASMTTDDPPTAHRGLGGAEPDARTQAQQRMREAAEMRAKIRMLEKKRNEDADRIRSLEETYSTQPAGLADLREKMAARFKELNQDLSLLRRQVKDHEVEKANFDGREAELLDQLEMNTLDREMAEEKADALTNQLTTFQEKYELLEVEVEVLKEENALYDRPPEPGTEKSSVAYVQLEKHNERLKAGIAKLHDQFTETDEKSRRRIAELERELNTNEGATSRLIEVRAELDQAKTIIEDLKQQLDGALGAEEMLEQLTERTLSMSDKIEEMRITIEDLEALKELSDELEETHADTERQQRDDIDELDNLLQDELTKVANLQDLIADREMTIGQFRDLVGSLHEQIDDLQAAESDQQSKTAVMSSHSQAVLNRNLQLQATRVKEQGRMIDIELARLEAQQANDHISILQAFVPEPYNSKDAAATEALLFLTRIARKAEVVLIAFCHIYDLPDALLEVTDDKLIGVCELRANISEMANYVKRSGGVMQRTTPEEYLNLAGSVPELRPVEEVMDRWLEALRQDEFSETSCAVDLAEILPRVKRFVESVFIREELDIGERHLGLAVAFDCDLDSFAAAVGFARVAVLVYEADDDAVVVESDDFTLEGVVKQPIQRILDQVRGVKLSSMKLREYMLKIQQQGASLRSDSFNRLRILKSKVEDATDLAFRLAGDIRSFFEDLRETGLPLRVSALMDLLGSVVAAVPGSGETGPWDLIGAFVTRLGSVIQQLLPSIQEAIDTDNLDRHTGTPPWILRCQAVRSEAASSADAELKVVKQGEQIYELVKQVKLRDQTLEETQVKAEVMRRKADEAIRQVDGLNETKHVLEQTQKQEKALKESFGQLQVEFEVLEKENARLRSLTSNGEKPSVGRASQLATIPLDTSSTGGLEAGQAYAQILSLKSAIRYLRHENTLLKAQDLLGDFTTLPHLPDRASTPELIHPGSDSPITSSDGSPMTPPPFVNAGSNMQPFAERKMLWRELAHFQASAEVVDLTKVSVGNKWKSVKSLPETQLKEREREEERIRKRARGFVERERTSKSRAKV